MTWFKIDDGFHGHPKVIRLPLEAVGLWALAGTWCADYLTDGALPMGAMLRLGGTVELADMLVEVNLWVRTDTGYRFREWEPYQPTKEQVVAEREAAKARMQRVRGGSGQRRAPDVRANSEGTSPAVRLPRPDPSYSSSDEELSTSSDVTKNEAAVGFERFWSMYPRKVGKPTARKAFVKASLRASVDEIIAGLESFLPVAATKEPQYIPHPSTWLNRDGWADEHTPDSTPMGNAMAVAAMGAAMEAQAQAKAHRELR